MHIPPVFQFGIVCPAVIFIAASYAVIMDNSALQFLYLEYHIFTEFASGSEYEKRPSTDFADGLNCIYE